MARDPWRSTTLGEVLELKRGYDLPARDRRDGPFPIVSSSGVSGYHATAMAKAPGVVTGRYGTLGQVFFIDRDYWPLNTSLYVRDFKGNDPRFVSYFLKSLDFMAYSDKAAVPGLNRNHLHMAIVEVPPLPEQRAIAAVLGALDDKIEVNRKTARVLEGIALAVFTSWFVDFDPVRRAAAGQPSDLPAPACASHADRDLAALFPKRLVDSPIGEVPEGWRAGTLGELGALTIGGDWGEDVPFAGATEAFCLRGVDLEHLRSTGLATPPRRWMKQSSIDRRTMDEREVLVAGSGAGPTGRPLWVCPGFMRTNTPVIYSNFCKRIRCSSAAAAVYLDAWLHRMRESGEIWEHVNGTSVPNLDANSLLAGKIVVIPPEPLLQKYFMLVRPMWERLFCGENRNLAALRDALLPKLISGELRIADAAKIVGRANRCGKKGLAAAMTPMWTESL